MAWGKFSAEAVLLHSQILRLSKAGEMSRAIDVIAAALAKAHDVGPSNMSYEEFDRLTGGKRPRQ